VIQLSQRDRETLVVCWTYY